MTIASREPSAVDPLDAATRELEAAKRAEATAKGRAQRAKAAHSRAHEETDAKRKALAAAIVTQARKGRRTAEIRRITGYTRQRVQQICRAAGVEPPE